MKPIIFTIIAYFVCPSLTFSQPFVNQSQWETYFNKRINHLDPIEGIWSGDVTMKIKNDYLNYYNSEKKVQAELSAIYKDGNVYKEYAISNENTVDVKIINTAKKEIFLMNLYFKNSNSTAKSNAFLSEDGVLLEFKFELPLEEIQSSLRRLGVKRWATGTRVFVEHQMVKIYPRFDDNTKVKYSYGSGFCLSSNGIIGTNYHVITDAKSIKVRGINGNFEKFYKAKIIASDKINDLALIQIDDSSFISTGLVPYSMRTGILGVGENIYVLGFPLRATMGDELKVTNGIISSRTGYQGDITTYQISAPVQPGNSGGPLFDSEGNLVGIITSKHLGAENVAYAIKINYLSNLIDIIPNLIGPSAPSLLKGKKLVQQIEEIKQFVYIIEAEL